jgi:gamma-glutamyltranspeptidase/glutathione hydrolase
VFNMLFNTIDYVMDVQSAVNTPRIVARNGSVALDDTLLTPALRAGLEARGFSVSGLNIGSVQAIVVGDDGMLYGAADPRRNGLALGQ